MGCETFSKFRIIQMFGIGQFEDSNGFVIAESDKFSFFLLFCILVALRVQITNKKKLSSCRVAYNFTFLFTDLDKPLQIYIK